MRLIPIEATPDSSTTYSALVYRQAECLAIGGCFYLHSLFLNSIALVLILRNWLKTKNAKYRIVKIHGKLVLHGIANTTPLKINVQTLASGLYGCVIISGSHIAM